MTTVESITWVEANQRYLMAALAELRQYLANHPSMEGSVETIIDDLGTPATREMADLRAAMSAPPALDSLGDIFGLSSFERNVVLICAGVELDDSFSELFRPQADPGRDAGPNFSFMLAHLPEAHWSALTPSGPLRYRHLVKVGAGDNLTLSPLSIDERVLHYLAGVPSLDERLMGYVSPLAAEAELVPSYRELADRIGQSWSHLRQGEIPALVHLSGPDRQSRWEIPASACAALGLGLQVMSVDALPADARDLAGLARLWERESALSHSALLLEYGDNSVDPGRERWIAQFVESLKSPLILSSREDNIVLSRPAIKLEVLRPTSQEQGEVWRECLVEATHHLNGAVDTLVAQFNLSASSIHSVAVNALERSCSDANSSKQLAESLWQGCCAQSRHRLQSLAQTIDPVATWDDLVIPATQAQTLREIATQVRHRQRVYDTWGFSGKSSRGLGISVLFSGGSGTGKTMAAEVLANELRLDLYRIDLSQVVSKYIGETEKNLRQVFDAAEDGGAILLFDEADALFGQRSEVKDSHDRYANIEISYLLQRMETYRGLAVLTTNMKSALDAAFLRRLRFTVQFPFPDVSQRAEIWRRVFPEATPTEGLNPEALARLNVSGGNIRNMAMTAAFLAADEDRPVTMKHLLSAARSEYAKLEKTLTDAEVRGWV